MKSAFALFVAGLLALISSLTSSAQVSFSESSTIPYEGFLSQLAVADVNGDGLPDLLVSAGSYPEYQTWVYLNQGGGTFSLSNSFPGSGWTVADLNGDSFADIVRQVGDHIEVKVGNGDGTFRAAPDYVIGSTSFTYLLADVDRDGFPDLVFAMKQGPDYEVGIAIGRGDGTFGPAALTVAPVPSSTSNFSLMGVGDFNGDHIADLLLDAQEFASPSSFDLLTVWMGNGDGTFQVSSDFWQMRGIYGTAVADLDLDGRDDLVLYVNPCHTPCHSVQTWFSSGDGSFRSGSSFADYYSQPWLGDFDHEGSPDLLIIGVNYPIEGVKKLALNNGDGTFQEPFEVDIPGTVRVVADFNNDHWDDLGAADEAAHIIHILLNTTGSDALRW